jgi:hypothetical protein
MVKWKVVKWNWIEAEKTQGNQGKIAMTKQKFNEPSYKFPVTSTGHNPTTPNEDHYQGNSNGNRHQQLKLVELRFTFFRELCQWFCPDDNRDDSRDAGQ